jgi:hypothetical protein
LQYQYSRSGVRPVAATSSAGGQGPELRQKIQWSQEIFSRAAAVSDTAALDEDVAMEVMKGRQAAISSAGPDPQLQQQLQLQQDKQQDQLQDQQQDREQDQHQQNQQQDEPMAAPTPAPAFTAISILPPPPPPPPGEDH